MASKAILVLILALAGFLSFYAVWKEGYCNTYYAAAVKSMLTGFHDFFFVSFDPGGFVSIDKPPLGLWIQTLSALVFGFQGWSLILPQAVAMVISTALVYHLVQRRFGVPAGLISALVFTLTPIAVAVSRTNNFDTVVVMLVLLAAWALIVAAEKGSLKLLLLSMAFVGLGFNTKMLQAYLVLPAIYLVYLLSPANKLRVKVGHLLVATVILLVVSLSWAAIVDTTPADLRPYVGGSHTNSVIELALNYNGIDRVTGMMGGNAMFGGASQNLSFGGMPDGPMGGMPGNMSAPAAMMGDGTPPGQNMPPGGMPGFAGGNMSAFGGMMGPGGEGGTPGVLRLFNQQLAGQISWLLPFAILGSFASALIIRKNGEKLLSKKMLTLIFWGMWMLPMLGYFSVSGFFHRYYMIMLAPSIAALCGIGLTLMWNEYRSKGRFSYLLPAAIAVTGAIQAVFISRYTDYSDWLMPAVLVASIVVAAVLLYARVSQKDLRAIGYLAACGFAILLVAPALWSMTPLIYHSESQIPYAGPELSYNNGMWDGNFSRGMGQAGNAYLTQFLLDHLGNETFMVAVPSSMSATGLILETGKPVMAVGGFSGSDRILTVDSLKEMVADGKLRYYMVNGMQDMQPSAGNRSFRADGMFGGQSELEDWVKANGQLVPESEWMGTDMNNTMGYGPGMGSMALYDLREDDA